MCSKVYTDTTALLRKVLCTCHSLFVQTAAVQNDLTPPRCETSVVKTNTKCNKGMDTGLAHSLFCSILFFPCRVTPQWDFPVCSWALVEREYLCLCWLWTQSNLHHVLFRPQKPAVLSTHVIMRRLVCLLSVTQLILCLCCANCNRAGVSGDGSHWYCQSPCFPITIACTPIWLPDWQCYFRGNYYDSDYVNHITLSSMRHQIAVARFLFPPHVSDGCLRYILSFYSRKTFLKCMLWSPLALLPLSWVAHSKLLTACIWSP